MHDQPSRLMAFLAVALALLNAGFHFHRGDVAATLYFIIAAILLTVVTHLNVRRNLI
jgi:hypothetical protein